MKTKTKLTKREAEILQAEEELREYMWYEKALLITTAVTTVVDLAVLNLIFKVNIFKFSYLVSVLIVIIAFYIAALFILRLKRSCDVVVSYYT